MHFFFSFFFSFHPQRRHKPAFNDECGHWFRTFPAPSLILPDPDVPAHTRTGQAGTSLLALTFGLEGTEQKGYGQEEGTRTSFSEDARGFLPEGRKDRKGSTQLSE